MKLHPTEPFDGLMDLGESMTIRVQCPDCRHSAHYPPEGMEIRVMVVPDGRCTAVSYGFFCVGCRELLRVSTNAQTAETLVDAGVQAVSILVPAEMAEHPSDQPRLRNSDLEQLILELGSLPTAVDA